MSDNLLKILLVEDSESDARLLEETIRVCGVNDLSVGLAASLKQAISHIKSNHVDAVLLDLTLPDSFGLETVQKARLACPDVPIVVLTGVDDTETGVEAVRMGVQDYLVKGKTDGHLIARAVRYAIERKRAQEEMLASETRFRRLFEAAHDGIIILDADTGQITEVNPFLIEILGYSRDAFLGKELWEIGLFADVVASKDAFLKLQREGYIRYEDLPLQTKDGRRIEVEFVSNSYAVDHKKVIQCNIRDITERKRMELELRKARDELEMRVRERTAALSKANKKLAAEIQERNRSENRNRIMNILLELFAQKTSRKEYLDSVVGAIHDWAGCKCVGIRLKNQDGFIPYESHIGFSDEFLATENMLSLKTDTCVCIRVITEKLEPRKLPVTTPKGSFRCDNTFDFLAQLTKQEKKRYRGSCIKHGFSSLAVVPIRYRQNVLGAIHLADKQENKIPQETVEFLENMATLIGEAVHRFDIESNLRESEEQYRRLVELSPDGIGVERDDKIVFVNTSGANLLGFSKPEELIGKQIWDFVHPDYRGRTHRQLEYLKRKQKAIPLRENKFLCAGGKILDVEVAATPLIYENKPAAQIVFRDITERKIAQERILADQKLLRSLTAELVLAEERERHEIATALHDSIGPVLAFTKRELGTLQKSVPLKIAEPLKNISFNISQAITQTRTLTFDLSPPTLYTLGFETAVEELVEKFCREQNLRFSYSNSKESKPLPDHVKILLYRSVRELLINSAKHAEAKIVRVFLSRVNGNISITVEDDGKGFNVAIFNSRSSRRSGLGLFSVQERLTHIGGKLEIESARGKGTKITLTAPLKSD